MDQLRTERPVKRRRAPKSAVLVMVHRKSGGEIRKRIKNSSRTVDLVTQHHARHPDYFVYRVNIYEKTQA